MNPYLSFLKLRFNVGLQYRFAAIAGIATQFFFGIMYLFLYEAYYRTGISTGMEWSQLVSYLWMGQAFFYLTYFNLVDSDILDSLITGQVSYELVRPMSIYWLWYARLLAKKLSGTVLRFFPVLIVAILLPAPYSLGAPQSIVAFCLFIITLLLGVILSLGIAMIIYSLMFYTTTSKGLISIYAVIADFFAGGIIPIPFMPEFLQKICFALPFRLVIDLPYRIYCGNIPIEDGLKSMMMQIVWIVITLFAGVYIMSNAQKRLVVQGG